MATKEIKSLLKSARTAFDRQEYEEAIKHCEVTCNAINNCVYAFYLYLAKGGSMVGQQQLSCSHPGW